MTHPVVENSADPAQEFLVAATNHDVIMPATVNANDRLIMVCTFFGTGADGVTTPANWFVLSSYTQFSSHGQIVFHKVADGTEDGTTVNILRGNTGAAVVIVRRISGGSIALVDFEVAIIAAPVSTINPDCPSYTSTWGADDNLFFAIYSGINDDVTVSAYPYASNQVAGSAGTSLDNWCNSALCTYNSLLAAENPGTFTISSAQFCLSQTLVLKPAATIAAVTVTINNGTSLSGLEWLVLDSQDWSIASILSQGTGGTTDVSDVLALDLTGGTNGQAVSIFAGNPLLANDGFGATNGNVVA